MMSYPDSHRDQMDQGETADPPSEIFRRWQAAIDAEDDPRCEALTRQLSPRDAPHIARLYRSEQNSYRDNHRWWAVRALADLSSVDEVEILNQAFLDPSSHVRAVAAHCGAQVAGQLWPVSSVHAGTLLEGIARLLLDELGFVRQTAADALAQVGEIALPVLTPILEGKDEGARTRAAYVLRKIQSPKMASMLYTLLEDRNPMVRLYAQEALEDMGLMDMVYFRS